MNTDLKCNKTIKVKLSFIENYIQRINKSQVMGPVTECVV